MRMRVVLTFMWSGFVLAGCSVGPEHYQPQIPLPESWSRASNDTNAVDTSEWWKHFNDPVLESLIADAQVANLDIAQALARVRQARALVITARAPFFPWFSLSGESRRSGSGGSDRTVVIGDAIVGDGSSGSVRNSVNAGLDMSWEIDLFGATRRSVESAQADARSFEELYRATVVILRGDVASGYFSLRGLQSRLKVAFDNLGAQEKNAEIVRKRNEVGFASTLDLSNAQAQVAITRAAIPQLESAVRQQMHALALLLGKEPTDLFATLEPPGVVLTVPDSVAIDIPSAVMRRRPDVRQAEANLAGATARVGVAVADLFPKFSISALLGTQGSSLGMLDSWESRVWNLATGVSQPLFQGGRLVTEVERQEALRDENIARYHQVVLTALKEVEDSLVAFHNEGRRLVELEIAVEKSRKALSSAEELYRSGLTDFLEVLTAERTLFSAEDSLAQSRTQRAVSLVNLYKALGGGAV